MKKKEQIGTRNGNLN